MSYNIEQIPLTYQSQVAAGNIQGHKSFNKFGENENVISGASRVIASFAAAGAFVPMTSASTLDIVSTSPNDAAAPATGAQTIRLTGIDANRNEQTETINLNGTTSVTTNLTWLGINRAEVITAGSLQANDGVINIYVSGAPTRIQAQIPITTTAPILGYSTTEQLIFHVPAGMNAHIYDINLNATKTAAGGGSVKIFVRGFYLKDGVKTLFFSRQVVSDVIPVIQNRKVVLPVIPGGAVWWFEAFTDGSAGVINGDVEQILVTA